MALLRTVEPATEPLTTAEAKLHLRVTSSTEDAIVDRLIAACRDMAQNELWRSLITQTWELTLDAFPDQIELLYPRILTVSSVLYLDATTGVQTALDPATYVVDKKSEPGWIVPAYGYTWPDTYETINAVTVTYTAGYGASASDVPAGIKNWILAHVVHYFDNRDAMVTGLKIAPLPFLGSLLDPYRTGRHF